MTGPDPGSSSGGVRPPVHRVLLDSGACEDRVTGPDLTCPVTRVGSRSLLPSPSFISFCLLQYLRIRVS